MSYATIRLHDAGGHPSQPPGWAHVRRRDGMEARWNQRTLASSEDIVVVEGNAYFPEESLDRTLVRPSSHRTVCGWKGEAHYYDVVVDDQVNANAIWYYPDPRPAAAQIRGRVAFWKGVVVS